MGAENDTGIIRGHSTKSDKQKRQSPKAGNWRHAYTTTHSIKDTVSAVQEKIASKRTTLVEESELTHVAAPDNPTKEFENRQERFALYRAMQQLDAETREVIHLRLAGDFSFRDIGDILGHSEVWARVRFYRGKEKLVKIIGGDNNA